MLSRSSHGQAIIALFQPGEFPSRQERGGLCLILRRTGSDAGPPSLPTRCRCPCPAIDRITIAQTAFGALVAFLFVLSNTVPQLAYSTKLDLLFSAS